MSWQYIAGFFDGEGCITLCRDSSFSPNVQMTQTEYSVLEIIKMFLEEHDIPSQIYSWRSQGPNCKQRWDLRIRGGRQTVKKFLENVIPYLIVKKLKAQDTLRTLVLYPPRNQYGAK